MELTEMLIASYPNLGKDGSNMAYLDASDFAKSSSFPPPSSKIPLYVVGTGGQGLAWAQLLTRNEQKIFSPHYCLRLESARRATLKSVIKKAPLLTPEDLVRSILSFGTADDFDGDDAQPEAQEYSAQSAKTAPLHVVVCLLISDDAIGAFYQKYLSSLENIHLTLVLAHGYSVYSGDLEPAKLNKTHEVALFAPKVIGPLLSAAQFDALSPHGFKAAVNLKQLSSTSQKAVLNLASALGFSGQNLIETTPEVEAMGDLISEQGLLCGGFLTLLKTTAEAMKTAGVPAELITEECLKELGYVVALVEKQGLSGSIDKPGMMQVISDAAKAGTVFAAHEFENHSVPIAIQNLTRMIQQKIFVKNFRDTNWKNAYGKLAKHLGETFPQNLKNHSGAGAMAGEVLTPAKVSAPWVKSFKMQPLWVNNSAEHDPLKNRVSPRRLSMLTAYDYPMATLVEEAGVDMILVGDSVAPVVHGEPDTLGATMDMMVLHTKAVAKATKRSLVVADMPFMSYQANISDALFNAGRLMKEGRAQAVKLEGGKEMAATVQALVSIGIPVVAHIGLTPQSINTLGGYRMHGKNEEEAALLKESALALEEAGAFCIVLECVAADVADQITGQLKIPTIGIGSGVGVCDGEVLVFHDVVGLTVGRRPGFVRSTFEARGPMLEALQKFVQRTNREGVPHVNVNYLESPLGHSAWLTT